MNYVDIVSRVGDVTLRVTPIRQPWDTETTQPAYDMQVTAPPDLDASGIFVEDDESPQTLTGFFRELADDHKGWDGDKHWQSLGADLKIRADHDQLNTTRLYVTLTGGVVPQWTLYAELHVDPGRFDRVSLNLELYGERLFGEDYDPDGEPVRIDPRQAAREPIRRIGSG
jgi:hypothetical protein